MTIRKLQYSKGFKCPHGRTGRIVIFGQKQVSISIANRKTAFLSFYYWLVFPEFKIPADDSFYHSECEIRSIVRSRKNKITPKTHVGKPVGQTPSKRQRPPFCIKPVNKILCKPPGPADKCVRIPILLHTRVKHTIKMKRKRHIIVPLPGKSVAVPSISEIE